MKVSVLLLLLVTTFSLFGQDVSRHIIVDQFGYLPGSSKVAVIKNPYIGFDSLNTFVPGNEYALVELTSQQIVFRGELRLWKNGEVDRSSGDKVWWFDFSEVEKEGEYFVLDIENNVRSYPFKISLKVYKEVLKHAVRTFFYQRAGFPKKVPFAENAWEDEASHVGPLQDKNCRLFNDPDNLATERDVHGGWYDAGDYNKYTSWTANYIVEFMKAYLENPDVWTDDYQIPESGNGVPDILDEARWGIESLMRLQEEDGSVLSIVDLDHASPPSAAFKPSLYGPATTSATLNTAGAFALASKVYSTIGQKEFADELKARAMRAWEWAEENPMKLFRNNDPAFHSQGIGAGQQEESDEQRLVSKIEAAIFLYELTEKEYFHQFIKENYKGVRMMKYHMINPFESIGQDALLYYASLLSSDPEIALKIRKNYTDALWREKDNYQAIVEKTDPYQAHLRVYTWGSNAVKSHKGNMFYNVFTYQLIDSLEEQCINAAEQYIHYLHGVNPLNLVYLSNMYDYGADSCINEFYHTWFTNGSAKWDRTGTSKYGPAPGFLVGGPNPFYNWDKCCPGDCGMQNNTRCIAESITPPKNQPSQKSYKDFNTSWPLNSWEVTENSCSYQIAYIRLLSKFVH